MSLDDIKNKVFLVAYSDNNTKRNSSKAVLNRFVQIFSPTSRLQHCSLTESYLIRIGKHKPVVIPGKCETLLNMEV